MKKHIRILSLLTALLMTGSALVSCAGEKVPSSEEKQNEPVTPDPVEDSTAPETEEAEETRPRHGLDLDALDFGGDELHSIAPYWQGYKYYFFADEENGNNMNDAVYSRRIKVEEALNIVMTNTFEADLGAVVSTAKANVLAGDATYDLVFNHCIQGNASLVSEGYLYNLDLLPYVDMKADWWNRTQMDALRLGKNTYFAVNDMMLPCPAVILFNKEMIRNNQLENPYDLVYEGRWTLDGMADLARAVTLDYNGDGVMDINDQYGLAATSWGSSCYINFMTGVGQFITSRSDEGRVLLDFNTEKTQSIFELFADLASTNIIYAPPSNEEDVILRLESDRVLFQILFLDTVETLRDCEVDFGILTYPKFDEQQPDYINLDWGGLLAVPRVISDPALIGAAMELLAWESGNEVIPAFYDLVLAGKLARDEDSVRMLDIIFDTIAYEVGGNYFGFDTGVNDLFYSLPRLAVNKKSSDFSSYYKKLERLSVKDIELFYENLDKIEEKDG